MFIAFKGCTLCRSTRQVNAARIIIDFVYGNVETFRETGFVLLLTCYLLNVTCR